MNQFVVDASTVLSWCFPDEHAEEAQRVFELFKRGGVAIVPAFWAHEVLSALLVGEKRKRISASLIKSFLDPRIDCDLRPERIRQTQDRAHP